MKERLESIRREAIEAIQSADVPEKLNEARVRFLGKKGELTAVLKGMKDVAPEERPKVGQMVNETQSSHRRDSGRKQEENGACDPRRKDESRKSSTLHCRLRRTW